MGRMYVGLHGDTVNSAGCLQCPSHRGVVAGVLVTVPMILLPVGSPQMAADDDSLGDGPCHPRVGPGWSPWPLA